MDMDGEVDEGGSCEITDGVFGLAGAKGKRSV